MTDYLSIGPTPADEPCQQVPYDDRKLAHQECMSFIGQLRRTFGQEPEGAFLFVKSERHEFGGYYEVQVGYDPRNEAAVSYAFRVEAETPSAWDAQAIIDLQITQEPR